MNNNARGRVVTLLYGKIQHMEVETRKIQTICLAEKSINIITTHICFRCILSLEIKNKKKGIKSQQLNLTPG